jgi:hypothetical protein
MPEPLNDKAAFGSKLVPVTVKLGIDWPWVPDGGEAMVMVDPKAVKDSGLEYRPAGYPGGVALVRQVHAVAVNPQEFAKWRTDAKKSARTKASAVKLPNARKTQKARHALKAHSPSIYVGTVASGADVIKSEKKKKELLRLHGKLLGTEMEGCGVMHAAFFHRETPYQALVIKGVSDLSNPDKAELDALNVWRELAVENSARLALSICPSSLSGGPPLSILKG